VDKVRGEDLLKRACDGGELDACLNFGDPKAQAESNRRMCDTEHVAGACSNIGEALAYGLGVPEDPRAGIAYLKLAASGEGLDQAVPAASVILANLEPNKEKGDSLYLLAACAHKYWPACAAHGGYLAEQKKDVREALPFWRDGCAAHDEDSCLWQAAYSWRGDGRLSKAAAAEEFERMCDSRVAQACLFAADSARQGFPGTPPDSARARALDARACELGQCRKIAPATSARTPQPSEDCRLLRQVVATCYQEKTNQTATDCSALVDGFQERDPRLGKACAMACDAATQGASQPVYPCQ